MEKYITQGVQAEINDELILLLFSMQESIPVEKDYLCVFELVPFKDKFIKIIMKQEVPTYEVSIVVVGKVESRLKLFLIDETLMLAEEY